MRLSVVIAMSIEVEMAVHTLQKYRVFLPQKSAIYVAGTDCDQVMAACLEGRPFKRHSEGPRWVRYKVETEMPSNWPHSQEGSGGGYLIDLETCGEIKVVLDE